MRGQLYREPPALEAYVCRRQIGTIALYGCIRGAMNWSLTFTCSSYQESMAMFFKQQNYKGGKSLDDTPAAA